MTMVMEPSIMKSHSWGGGVSIGSRGGVRGRTHAGLPPLPSMRETMPAAMSPPNALASMLLPYKMAILGGSSARLYQQLIK